MHIKILGPGCTNCANLEKVTDYAEIVAYDIMRTPGLVVDDRVVLSGRVPSAAQVRDLLAPLVA